MNVSDSDSKKKPSQTLPWLLLWLFFLPASYSVQVLFTISGADLPWHGLQIPLGLITDFSGLCTFTYLGIEYSNNFIQNAKLPQGQGQIEKLSQYRFFIAVWMLYLVGGTACNALFKTTFPLQELTTFSGTITVAYIAGQKGNKIAVNMGTQVMDFTGNGAQASTGGAFGVPGALNSAWTSPPPTSPTQQPTGPVVPR